MPSSFITTLPDRAVLSISGDDAAPFLQGLITNDVDKLSEARALYAALLTPQGKILFDFFIVAHGSAYLVDCAADQAADLRKRLTFYKLRAAVDVDDVSGNWSVAALWGVGNVFGLGSDPGSAASADGGVVYADPRTISIGLRAVLPAGNVEGFAQAHELETATFDDYHFRRIALGLADSGADIGSGELFPHECNLDQIGGVDFKKGCYVGQEVVSRTEHRSTARKRIIPVSFDDDAAASGADISANGKVIGTVLSGTGAHALALVRLDRAASALEAGAPLEASGHTLVLHQPPWAQYEVPGAVARP